MKKRVEADCGTCANAWKISVAASQSIPELKAAREYDSSRRCAITLQRPVRRMPKKPKSVSEKSHFRFLDIFSGRALDICGAPAHPSPLPKEREGAASSFICARVSATI